jgi:hypothetical protein
MAIQPVKSYKQDFVRNTFLKQPIVKSMYDKARNNYRIVGNVTFLAEEAIERGIMTARDTVACTADSKIIIVEIDKSMHDYQVAWMKKLYEGKARIPTWQSKIKMGDFYEPLFMHPLGYNVEFVHDDIANVKSTIFMDVDLMKSMKTCGWILMKTLRKQRATFPLGTPEKGFIFTLSLRGSGPKEETLMWIEKELIPLTGGSWSIGQEEIVTLDKDTRRSPNGFRGINSHKYQNIHRPKKPNELEIVHDVMIHSYSDGGGSMLTGIIIYS